MKDAPETTLVLKRTFKAPVSIVYAAWVEAEQFAQWMGPANDMICNVTKHEARVGGTFAFRIISADGKTHGASGQFREVVENERLVFTWTWDHVPDTETLATVEFRESAEGRTTMTFTHERHASSESRDNHRGGWTGSFGKLERLVEEAAAAN